MNVQLGLLYSFSECDKLSKEVLTSQSTIQVDVHCLGHCLDRTLPSVKVPGRANISSRVFKRK